jgi:hypothetical protein
MEAEVVKDVKKAKPCECGHPAAQHEVDGVGHCTATGCNCPGAVAADDSEEDDDDEAV